MKHLNIFKEEKIKLLSLGIGEKVLKNSTPIYDKNSYGKYRNQREPP